MRPEPQFIAETANAHEGDSAYQKKLIEALCTTDCDIVKLQILREPEVLANPDLMALHQSLILPEESWKEDIATLRAAGKRVLVLPVDLQACRWVLEQDLADMIEVHAVNLMRHGHA